MNAQGFKTRIEASHKNFLANLLCMEPSNGEGGIDLVDGDVAIELKCCWDKYRAKFTCAEYQFQKFPKEYLDRTLYWAFAYYCLSKDRIEIDRRRRSFDRYVVARKIWFMPWEFLDTLKLHNPRTGPYRYVYKKNLPDDDSFSQFWIQDNSLLVPKDSSLETRLVDLGFGNCRERVKIVVEHSGSVKTVNYKQV